MTDDPAVSIFKGYCTYLHVNLYINIHANSSIYIYIYADFYEYTSPPKPPPLQKTSTFTIGPTKTPGSPRPLLDVAWQALMLPLALVVPAAPAVLRPVPGDA